MIREETESGEKIEIPLTFGQYSYVRTIGKGNYSVVVLVVSSISQQQYACKVVTRAGLQTDGAMQRFIQEIDILQSLKHPNIVEILDVLYTEVNIYVVTEFCLNGSLFQYIIDHPSPSHDNIRRIFFQVATAIYFLHQRNIAHRDIKPENILLDENYSIKLADFGFSRQISENHLLKTPCGSPFYAAPEIIKGQQYDGMKSDIWSLGVLLFVISTGALPWTAVSQTAIYLQIFNAQFEIPIIIEKDVADTITNCMKLEPADRLTAYELLHTDFLKPLSRDEHEMQQSESGRRRRGKFAANSLICKNNQPPIYHPSVANSVVLGQQLRKASRKPGIRHLKAPQWKEYQPQRKSINPATNPTFI